LILGNLVALSMVIGQVNYLFTQLVLLGVLLLLCWQAFRLMDATNHQLSKFLFAINYQDYNLSFPEEGQHSFQELKSSLSNSMRQLAAKKEKIDQQAEWLNLLVEKLPIALIIAKENGKVEIINQRACDLLSIPLLSSLEQLDEYHAGFLRQLKEAKAECSQKVQLGDRNEIQLYKMQTSKEGEKVELFFLQSFEELKGEVEMQAWLSLIKVLTHEVMNSITSISSLATTLNKEMKIKGMKDMQAAAYSIEKRSKGLIQFTENYREVSSIQAAHGSWFLLSSLVKEQQQFLKEELEGITIEIITDREQQLYGDREQIGHVLINLFLNAKAALIGIKSPRINIHICQERQLLLLHFTDNGKGIALEEQNKIFIPFYSTRKGGKGIGLSLCRQLMQNNEGSVSLKKSEAGKTTFELRWKIIS